MWFLDKFPGAAAAYVLPLALRMQGPWGGAQQAALQASLTKDRARGFTADGPHADDLTIEFYNLETSAVRQTVFAERGRVRVEAGDGGRFVIGDDGKIELFEVEVVQHEGGPVTPLTIRSTHIVTQIDRENFRSVGDDPVSARAVVH